MLTFEQIKELIELVATRKLQGLEVERSGFRLRIDGQEAVQDARPPAPAAPEAPPRREPAPAPAEPSGEPVPASAAAPEPEEGEAEVPEGAHVLKSPIVGTFYRASAPDADPYVEEGDGVKKGQVLCIVEAMKLMNEIEADVDGKVVKIFPEDAQPVEFGEALFAIEPA